MIETGMVIIVGSGPSVRKCDFNRVPDDCQVVAINSMAEALPRADHFFTMDTTEIARPRHSRRIIDGVCWAAVPDRFKLPPWFIRLKRLALCGRDGEHPTPEPTRRNSPEWWFWRWSATPTLCETQGEIHTGNSVWGALQLAYQSKATAAILCGLDGTMDDRITGGRPNNLNHLPMLFRSAMPQIQERGMTVVNANPHSRVDCFPRMKFDEALEYVKETATNGR